MKIQITMDNFPMAYLKSFRQDLETQGIVANIQVGGYDTVFLNTEVADVVKAQIVTIICDKYHFAKKGGVSNGEEEKDSS